MKTEPAPAAIPRITSVVRLTSSGFTEVQARTLAEIVHTEAEETVEGLKHEVARWHAYLALYLMMQIAIVLLAILLLQALSEPVRGSRPVLDGAANTSSQQSGAAIHSQKTPTAPRSQVLQVGKTVLPGKKIESDQGVESKGAETLSR